MYLQAAVSKAESVRQMAVDGEGGVSVSAGCSNKSRNSVRQKCMDGEGVYMYMQAAVTKVEAVSELYDW